MRTGKPLLNSGIFESDKPGDRAVMRILFICHGNICRSPMAEMMLKAMVRGQGLAERFDIASRATSTEEIIGGVGNPIYPPARAELAKHGIPCEKRCAVQLRREDYNLYDLLICMDAANVRNALRILGGDPHGKVHKLMDYTDRGSDVADPWYTGRFDAAYRDIEAGCAGLLSALARTDSGSEKTGNGTHRR